VLFKLGLGVIDASRTSRLGEPFRPRSIVNQNAGADINWDTKKASARIMLNPLEF
jgi:hypothetical protein